jgi:peptide/nickel transport system substrate-binding protein
MLNARFLLFFILISLLSSCSRIEQKNKCTYNLLHVGADPKTFNAWTASDATSSNYAGLMFEGLIRVHPIDNSILPGLAEKLTIEDSGKKIIAHLRNDIFWNDGEEINADDVVFTWNELIRDGIAVSSMKDILMVDGQFPTIKKIDNKTIEFTISDVFAPFAKSLSLEIAPKHDIEKYFKKLNANSFEEKQKAFNNYLAVDSKDIVCSGPFKVSKLISGQRIEMIKNPRYFLKSKHQESLPYIEKIVYTYAPDPNAAIFRFLAKEAHLVDVSPVNVALMQSLAKQYDYTLQDFGPSTGTNFIWFNLSTNVKKPKYTWFNNEAFREAVSFSIDREVIVKAVFQGYGAKLFTAEAITSPFINNQLAAGYPRDIKKAKALLTENGFKYIKNELFDSDNHRIEFDLYTNAGNPERELIAIIVQKNLSDIGIKVNLKFLEFNNFVSKIMQGKDYEAGIISLTGSNEPNDGANVWKSSGRLHLFDIKASQERPIIRDWENEIDNLLTSGVKTIDTNERKKIYDKVQEIVSEHNPLIYIASPRTHCAFSKKIDVEKFDRLTTSLINLPYLKIKE